MTYNTKTIYPAQEDKDGRKLTTTKQTDIAVELKKDEVLKLYILTEKQATQSTYLSSHLLLQRVAMKKRTMMIKMIKQR